LVSVPSTKDGPTRVRGDSGERDIALPKTFERSHKVLPLLLWGMVVMPGRVSVAGATSGTARVVAKRMALNPSRTDSSLGAIAVAGRRPVLKTSTSSLPVRARYPMMPWARWRSASASRTVGACRASVARLESWGVYANNSGVSNRYYGSIGGQAVAGEKYGRRGARGERGELVVADRVTVNPGIFAELGKDQSVNGERC
jgi:hypothetical protein